MIVDNDVIAEDRPPGLQFRASVTLLLPIVEIKKHEFKSCVALVV
jgi:hypothetical protein